MNSRPPAIFGIGRNYADHAAEMKGDIPERPMVFMKNPASVIGHGDSIVIPSICQRPPSPPESQVDYEGELGVIIGRDCRDVAEADALDVVSHLCVANDVSARWWQKKGSGGQFVRGKSFDTFCPMSAPVALETVSDVQSLSIATYVNDVQMQDGSTSDMIFPVATLVSELSRGLTLLERTLILTGTPAGVGAGQSPPLFLKDGDVVRIEISGVGVLTNSVRTAIC